MATCRITDGGIGAWLHDGIINASLVFSCVIAGSRGCQSLAPNPKRRLMIGRRWHVTENAGEIPSGVIPARHFSTSKTRFDGADRSPLGGSLTSSSQRFAEEGDAIYRKFLSPTEDMHSSGCWSGAFRLQCHRTGLAINQ